QIAEVIPLEQSTAPRRSKSNGQPTVKTADSGMTVLLLRVDYREGEPDGYLLPVSAAWGAAAERMLADRPKAVLAKLNSKARHESGVLYDALEEPLGGTVFLDAIANRRRFKASRGELVGLPAPALEEIAGPEPASLQS